MFFFEVLGVFGPVLMSKILFSLYFDSEKSIKQKTAMCGFLFG